MTTTPTTVRRTSHITIVSETFPPEINGVANTLRHLCQGLLLQLADQPTLLNRIRAQARLDALELNWASQIEQFEQLVFNQPIKANDHAINNQSVSLL